MYNNTMTLKLANGGVLRVQNINWRAAAGAAVGTVITEDVTYQIVLRNGNALLERVVDEQPIPINEITNSEVVHECLREFINVCRVYERRSEQALASLERLLESHNEST